MKGNYLFFLTKQNTITPMVCLSSRCQIKQGFKTWLKVRQTLACLSVNPVNTTEQKSASEPLPKK